MPCFAAHLAENVKFNLGMFVGVREFSAGVDYLFGQKGNSYSGPTGVKAISDAVKPAQRLGKDEYDIGLAKAAVAFASDLTGAPGTQITTGGFPRGSTTPGGPPISLAIRTRTTKVSTREG